MHLYKPASERPSQTLIFSRTSWRSDEPQDCALESEGSRVSTGTRAQRQASLTDDRPEYVLEDVTLVHRSRIPRGPSSVCCGSWLGATGGSLQLTSFDLL